MLQLHNFGLLAIAIQLVAHCLLRTPGHFRAVGPFLGEEKVDLWHRAVPFEWMCDE